jgi:hypothetical protein
MMLVAGSQHTPQVDPGSLWARMRFFHHVFLIY